jgi:hypothetical protein
LLADLQKQALFLGAGHHHVVAGLNRFLEGAGFTAAQR